MAKRQIGTVVMALEMKIKKDVPWVGTVCRFDFDERNRSEPAEQLLFTYPKNSAVSGNIPFLSENFCFF